MLSYRPVTPTTTRTLSTTPAPRFGIRVKPRTRLLLVDEHVLFRRGIKATLEATGQFEVVAEAGSAQSALQLAEELLPQIVLLELKLAGNLNGLDLCQNFRRRLPDIKTVVISSSQQDETLFAVLKAGASAYLPKLATPNELVEIVSRVAEGHYPINESVMSRPELARQVLSQFQSLPQPPQLPQADLDQTRKVEGLFSLLTNRELEVLEAISRGGSNKEIANWLSISDQTVKNHMSSILKKLNANDRTQAVLIALERGWITL
jgi:DNA-binding NarL/FixJ family response regulator